MRTSDLPTKRQGTQPAPSQTISEKAYQLLRADIIAGSLAPGEKLRLQTLQERYELGLSPIREALMLLCGDGLVSNEGQRGFSVSKLSKSDLLDLMHARTSVELLLLADAIEHGDDDWGANIMAAYYKLTKARLPTDASDTVAVELWETTHRRFHFALIAAAQSQWLLRIDEQLVDHSERYRRIRLAYSRPSKELADDVMKEHLDLMEAVLARDTEQASNLLRQHLMRTAEVLSKRFAD
jgi:DNA-binding GntR family transcriptional regulator